MTNRLFKIYPAMLTLIKIFQQNQLNCLKLLKLKTIMNKKRPKIKTIKNVKIREEFKRMTYY